MIETTAKWVYTKDRLPEDPGYYMVATIQRTFPMIGFCSFSYGFNKDIYAWLDMNEMKVPPTPPKEYTYRIEKSKRCYSLARYDENGYPEYFKFDTHTKEVSWTTNPDFKSVWINLFAILECVHNSLSLVYDKIVESLSVHQRKD